MEKRKSNINDHVTYSFWAMIALFALTILFSAFMLQLPSMICAVLFGISMFYTLVSSIKSIFPENSFAYIALAITSIFILFIMFSIIFANTGSTVLR
ncbi:MAG TPA: hypothetical protein VEC16_04480 [Alphaproteobacteria bacterium]|nr:hypothetical protein [Alphaproteobacteria bacterium]